MILVGNNVVNIAMSSLITVLSIQFFGSAGVGIATAIATITILIFGEILPKSIALQRPEKIALRVSLPISFFLIVLSPIVYIFSLISRIIASLLGIKKAKAKSTVTEEDIKTMIEIGEEEGLIESQKKAMLHRILRYTDLIAKDIMTPRTDIVSISVDSTRKEILALSHSSRYSRFPVYGTDSDDILGILFIKDFLFSPQGDSDSFSVKALLRPALFIFETQRMSKIQETMRNANQNLAVIIDEYGGTAGIVTIADLAEKIFGSLRDEFDAHEKKPIQPDAPGMKEIKDFLINGATRLEEINERFGIHLSSEYFDTIGGFIMEKKGDIAELGTVIQEQGLTFTVVQISANRIDSLRIDRMGIT